MDTPIPPQPDPTPAHNAHRGDNPSPFDHLLASVYHHLPVVVLHLTLDGLVLHMNPAAERLLGYSERELVGKNFWAVLFPGRLFAQVPRFMSAVDPLQQFSRDVPMTIRTKDGRDRTLAWTRHDHTPDTPGAPKTLLCMGVDLTDRLTNADLPARPDAEPSSMGVGNGGTLDGEFVTPIAITPPATGSPAVAIAQVHEFLTEVSTRVDALQSAFEKGEMEQLAAIASALGQGAYACGLLDFSARAERLHLAASGRALADVTDLVKEIAAMVRHGGAANDPHANDLIG